MESYLHYRVIWHRNNGILVRSALWLQSLISNILALLWWWKMILTRRWHPKGKLLRLLSFNPNCRPRPDSKYHDTAEKLWHLWCNHGLEPHILRCDSCNDWTFWQVFDKKVILPSLWSTFERLMELKVESSIQRKNFGWKLTMTSRRQYSEDNLHITDVDSEDQFILRSERLETEKVHGRANVRQNKKLNRNRHN